MYLENSESIPDLQGEGGGRCHVARRIRASDALDQLTDLFVEHGTPEHVRSDNGPEFIEAKILIEQWPESQQPTIFRFAV